MLRLFVLTMVFGLFSAPFEPAVAQNQVPSKAGDRFTFQVTDQGVLRFDSRTGEVSQCTVGASGAICRAAPDERATFESEIARLEAENAALKKALADNGAAVSRPPVPPAPIPNVADNAPGPDSKTPPESPHGRIRTTFDTAWRNLVALMSRMKSALQNG